MAPTPVETRTVVVAGGGPAAPSDRLAGHSADEDQDDADDLAHDAGHEKTQGATPAVDDGPGAQQADIAELENETGHGEQDAGHHENNHAASIRIRPGGLDSLRATAE
jgi:predicted  nucleic acid-binding Zn-ribbon protein